MSGLYTHGGPYQANAGGGYTPPPPPAEPDKLLLEDSAFILLQTSGNLNLQ